MISNSSGSLTDTVNSAAAPARSMVEQVIAELNSGYGDTLSSVQPYKSVNSAALVDSFFDASAMNIFGNVEIISTQQSPYGDNYDTQRNFRISRDEAHQIAELAPQGFRARFQHIADALDQKYAEHAADFAAHRENQRIQGIEDTVNQMSRLDRNIAAPKAARFTKRQ